MISTSLSTLRRSSLEVHCTNLAAKVSPEVKCTHFSTFPNFPLEDRSESCYRIWNFDNGEDFELSSMDMLYFNLWRDEKRANYIGEFFPIKLRNKDRQPQVVAYIGRHRIHILLMTHTQEDSSCS